MRIDPYDCRKAVPFGGQPSQVLALNTVLALPPRQRRDVGRPQGPHRTGEPSVRGRDPSGAPPSGAGPPAGLLPPPTPSPSGSQVGVKKKKNHSGI